jgi:3-methyl-2-oxobutanoate hydroxymethyltransferase
MLSAGAQMVKMEGGAPMVETTRFLVDRGVPVCAHIGLTPQSVNTLGGYRVQGKSDAAAEKLLADAKALEQAGAAIVLMEAVPAALAKRVTESLSVPTIGIGAGPDVSGQVLVLYDMLDIYPGKKARFVKNFMQGSPSVKAGIEAYVKAVKDKSYPAPEHCF